MTSALAELAPTPAAPPPSRKGGRRGRRSTLTPSSAVGLGIAVFGRRIVAPLNPTYTESELEGPLCCGSASSC